MPKLLILIVFLSAITVQAQVYKTVDEDGNVVFTDAPPAGNTTSERIDIRQPNTAPPPDMSILQKEPAAEEPEGEVATVRIVSPLNETSFPMGPGNFDVEAQVSPALADGQALQLAIDGIPWGQPQGSTRWALTNVFRGAHDLTVTIVDDRGETLATSEPIRVFVHRPSVNFRNRN